MPSGMENCCAIKLCRPMVPMPSSVSTTDGPDGARCRPGAPWNARLSFPPHLSICGTNGVAGGPWASSSNIHCRFLLRAIPRMPVRCGSVRNVPGAMAPAAIVATADRTTIAERRCRSSLWSEEHRTDQPGLFEWSEKRHRRNSGAAESSALPQEARAPKSKRWQRSVPLRLQGPRLEPARTQSRRFQRSCSLR